MPRALRHHVAHCRGYLPANSPTSYLLHADVAPLLFAVSLLAPRESPQNLDKLGQVNFKSQELPNGVYVFHMWALWRSLLHVMGQLIDRGKPSMSQKLLQQFPPCTSAPEAPRAFPQARPTVVNSTLCVTWLCYAHVYHYWLKLQE